MGVIRYININALKIYDIVNILVEIPARGGSKGVPRKALRTLGEHPLIAYTIIDALRIKGNTKVIVNTDDPDIKTVAIKYGAEVPFLRPKKLATDSASLDDVVKYSSKWLLDYEGYIADIYIIMSPTNPFRRRKLINDSIEKGLSDQTIFNIGGVAPAEIDVENLWIKEEGNLVSFTGEMNEKGKGKNLCQSSMSFNIVFNNRLDSTENNHTPVMLNNIEAIDIDEKHDFDIAKKIIQNGYYPFSRIQKNTDFVQNIKKIFEKYIYRNIKSNKNKIYYKNTNFPLIKEEDYLKFQKYCHGKSKIIMTGSKTAVHPYRLKFIDQNGYSRFLYRVSRDIRGNRQSYPDVFSFSPAMFFIPAGTDFHKINFKEVEMYEIERSKLIDKSKFPNGAFD